MDFGRKVRRFSVVKLSTELEALASPGSSVSLIAWGFWFRVQGSGLSRPIIGSGCKG